MRPSEGQHTSITAGDITCNLNPYKQMRVHNATTKYWYTLFPHKAESVQNIIHNIQPGASHSQG